MKATNSHWRTGAGKARRAGVRGVIYALALSAILAVMLLCVACTRNDNMIPGNTDNAVTTTAPDANGTDTRGDALNPGAGTVNPGNDAGEPPAGTAQDGTDPARGFRNRFMP